MCSHTVFQLATQSYNFTRQIVLEPLRWGEFSQLFEIHTNRRQNLHAAYMDVLPTLTCLAIGGEFESTLPVNAAWILYILAARMLDDLFDNQGQESIWQGNGCSKALSYALFALGAGNSALSYIQKETTYKEISQKFNQTLAMAAQVQQESSDSFSLSIEAYFKAIAAKTGMVFAVGAWAGGYLATDEPRLQSCQALYDYGLNAGLMLQIIDDCTDLAEDLARGDWTLPVLHALAHVDDEQRPELIADLKNAKGGSLGQIQRLVNQIDKCGSMTWSLQVAGAYQQRAIAALESFPPERKAHLVAYVSQKYDIPTV